MGDINEQTIVISDLLSFLACKIKFTSKENLLRTLRQYYSEKDINEAHKTLLASLPEKKSTRHGRRVKNPDPLIAMYDCFQLIPVQELPVFVCKNLNNVPELDIIKEEPQAQVEEEEYIDEDNLNGHVVLEVEKTLREEQKTMKLQIADIAFVVQQLKDQLDNISHQSPLKSKCISKVKSKRSNENYSSLRPSKKFHSEIVLKKSKLNSDFKKKGLAYLQSLIDEDEDKTDKDQSERDVDSDFQDGIDYLSPDFEELDAAKDPEEISCEVILKEEPEDLEISFNRCEGRGDNNIYLVSPSKSEHIAKYLGEEGSPSKTVCQKVIYIKNNEEQDRLEEEENSIEITSSSDFLGNFEEDPLSRIGTLDSIITISKNTSSESIIIEKIEATNGEGYYYKCQRCQFICNEEKMILKHECNSITVDIRNRKPRRRSKFSPSNMWVCTICDAYVIDVVKYNEHMLDHHKIMHGNGDYECVLCTLKTDNFNDYKVHLLEHSWKTPYTCDLCDYKSTKELRMRNHAVKHLECKGPNHFECLICRKICGTRNALEKHKQRHKKNYDFKCDICGLTFRHRSALSQHTLNHTKERTFVCQICNYRYDSQHSLDVHVKVHFRDDLFSCHICNQKFKSKNTYRNHVLSMHEGIKPFKCDLCNEAFIFKHTMLMHRKTHGNQLYVCAYCHKKFKSQHYLKVHCAVHEGKSPFRCASCEFSSVSKSILKKHMSTHAETLNLLSCASCNYVTVYPNEMDKHTRSSHPTNGSFDQSKMVIIMETPQ